MDTNGREQLKQLLLDAARLPPEQRRDFVIRSTAANPEITAEAIELLATLDDPRFMNAPTGAGFESVNGRSTLEGPGQRIGRYKLLQKIGEGGFGVVFLAEQVEPVVRRVALKIIKAGMDTKQVIARFEAERQALAMMDHPNIARVLDAGQTEQGRPYFVMELVRGEPVTRYCDREKLPISERLTLFRDICFAVQHAHQKGIIHRDLKPSNVLVTSADGRPLPKVIDFGIAKATEVRLTDKTYFTELHQLVGTPEYMSPEQAEISGIDIDTRSDVYSLGVLLYELLAGGPPFDSRRLRSSPLAEIQRIICDEEPPRPSTRLRTLGNSSNITVLPRSGFSDEPSTDAISEIAERRRMEPLALTRSLQGDLDWIVMKCLEKERTRRYATAVALADDVSAFLTHKPVTASPPSRVYKLKKLYHRHRRAVVAGVVVVLALVVSTIVSIRFAFEASRALEAEAEQRAVADQRAAETRQVAEFQSELLSGISVEAVGTGFKQLFRKQVEDSLRRQFVGKWPDRRKLTADEVSAKIAEYDQIVGPAQAVDVARRVLSEYVLRNDVKIIEQKFADQPRVQAELLLTLGTILRNLGLNEDAEPALRRAVELRRTGGADDEVLLADALSELSSVLGAQGRSSESEAVRRDALAIYESGLGSQNEKSIIARSNIAINRYEQGDMAGAEDVFREALAQARALPENRERTLAQILNDLGGLLLATGNLDEAEKLISESLDLRRELSPDGSKEVADSLLNLAGVYHSRNDYASTEKYLRETIDMYHKVLGEEHVVIATCLNNLAATVMDMDDMPTAIALAREALAMNRKLLGDDHPDVIINLNNLAMMYQLSGDLAAAEPLLRETLDVRRSLLGNDHPDVAVSESNMGYQLLKQKDPAGAEPHFREALSIYARKNLTKHHSMYSSKLGMALCLADQGKTAEAEAILGEMSESPGMDGLPAYLRGTYVNAHVRLYEAKDRASPNEGFDELARQWREKSKPRTASAPAEDVQD
jgi:serine/threonine protein kinase/tetratricopeptide (TPR) repeat protein